MTFRAFTAKEWLALAVAFLLLVAVAVTAISQDRDSGLRDARSAYENCVQIELVKHEIRGTVKLSRERLAKVAYYRTHPDELALALRDADKSIKRFQARDCLKLPSVVGFPADQLRR